MSQKIIVSSGAMYKFLIKLAIDGLDDEGKVTTCIVGEKFSVPEISDDFFLCEARGDGIGKTYIFKLRQLRDLLAKIQDQPIVIVFYGVNMEITSIQI